MSVTHMSEHEREEIETHEQRALGFWLYLMGDAVIFALLFATYSIMIPGTAGGPTGKQLFDLNNAALETVLLLVSSTTFGFASLQVKAGNRGAVLGFAMIWHIWWLVLAAGIVMLGAVIVRSSNDDQEFTMSAAEVKAIEDERFRLMGSRP